MRYYLSIILVIFYLGGCKDTPKKSQVYYTLLLKDAKLYEDPSTRSAYTICKLGSIAEMIDKRTIELLKIKDIHPAFSEVICEGREGFLFKAVGEMNSSYNFLNKNKEEIFLLYELLNKLNEHAGENYIFVYKEKVFEYYYPDFKNLAFTWDFFPSFSIKKDKVLKANEELYILKNDKYSVGLTFVKEGIKISMQKENNALIPGLSEDEFKKYNISLDIVFEV